MIDQAKRQRADRSAGEMLVAAIGREGSRAAISDITASLDRNHRTARNIADLVHHLCLLHGRHPGVVDYARALPSPPSIADLLEAAADAFARERDLLTRLVVTVGAPPSTPGHASSEAAVLAQHHAVEMLARSERNGCAMGAAFALCGDWLAIRPILDAAAERLGVAYAPASLPALADVAIAIDTSELALPAQRAMLFGADQILIQHRGLWDLLRARAEAREAE